MSKKTKNIRNISLSDFYCTKCGTKGIPCFRTVGKEREPGHLKKLFCLNCQKEQNMAEIRSRGKYNLNDFWIEYEYGNFNEEGLRKEPWKIFVSKTKQEMMKNEK